MQPIKVKLGVFGAEGKRNVGLCHEMCLQWGSIPMWWLPKLGVCLVITIISKEMSAGGK